MSEGLIQFAPRYRIIANDLRQKIRKGLYRSRETIPSEAMLVKQYKVSRGTVREALQLLTQEELLLRRPGKGTIVAPREKPLLKTTLVFSHPGAYSLTHPYLNTLYHSFEAGVEDFCRNSDSNISVQSVRLAKADNDYGFSLLEIEDVFQDRLMDPKYVQGICLTAAVPKQEVLELQKRGIFCVHLDGYEDSKCPVVCFDRYKIRELAMLHLKDMGHRNIGFVMTKGDTKPIVPWPKVMSRLKKKAEEIGLNLDDRYNVILSDWGRDIAAEGVKNLFRLQGRPTALICADDFLAMGAWDAAKELGFSVPGDLSIVGFGNYNSDTYLTTIQGSLNQMGRIGAEILLKSMQMRYEGPNQVCLDELKLLNRASTGSVPE